MSDLRTGNDVVVPRWQPDEELAECSICGHAFTFLNRRHHCRRCGRLVCGPCSPHRITIPRQYIVRPAEEEDEDEDGNTRSRSNTGSSTDADNPALGGGETVRVCNPCVPDPNYGPPPQNEEQRSPLPSRSRAHTHGAEAEAPSSEISFLGRFGLRDSAELLGTTSQSVPLNARSLSSFGSNPPRQADGRGGYRPQLHTARFQALNSIPQRPNGASTGLRTRSDNDASNASRRRYRSWSNVNGNANVVAEASAGGHEGTRTIQAPSDEDECPVCGTRAYPFGTIGTMQERERHVEYCISNHLGGPSTSSGSPLATPSQTGPGAEDSQAGEAGPAASSAPVPQRTTSTLRASTARQRMLVYHATEKDCFDEEGEAQECVICFEEFQAGDEMGRLECLCKFHRSCIKSWWEKRGRGTCPTHQLHD